MRRLSLILALLLCLGALNADAFEPKALEGLPGFSREGESWRSEQVLSKSLLLLRVEVGLVAEGTDQPGQETLWGWAQYVYLDEDRPIDRVTFRLGGKSHEFINLEVLTDSQGLQYGTWGMGEQGLQMMRQLQEATELELTVHWGDQHKLFTFTGHQLAAMAAWSKAILQSGVVEAVGQEHLQQMDRVFYAPIARGEPVLVGSSVQERLSSLPGYAYDRRAARWSYEDWLHAHQGDKEMSLRFLLEGGSNGDLYTPSLSFYYLQEDEPQQPYQLRVETDQAVYIIQRPERLSEFSVWFPGMKSHRLFRELEDTQSLRVQLYLEGGIAEIAYNATELATLRQWASAIQRLKIYDEIGASQLMQMDVQQIVSVEDKQPVP